MKLNNTISFIFCCSLFYASTSFAQSLLFSGVLSHAPTGVIVATNGSTYFWGPKNKIMLVNSSGKKEIKIPLASISAVRASNDGVLIGGATKSNQKMVAIVVQFTKDEYTQWNFPGDDVRSIELFQNNWYALTTADEIFKLSPRGKKERIFSSDKPLMLGALISDQTRTLALCSGDNRMKSMSMAASCHVILGKPLGPKFRYEVVPPKSCHGKWLDATRKKLNIWDLSGNLKYTTPLPHPIKQIECGTSPTAILFNETNTVQIDVSQKGPPITLHCKMAGSTLLWADDSHWVCFSRNTHRYEVLSSD